MNAVRMSGQDSARCGTVSICVTACVKNRHHYQHRLTELRRSGMNLRTFPSGMRGGESSQSDSGTVLAQERTDLAIKRSAFAAERTLMAWVRTAISMIGFGFTIVKFFQYLPSEIAKGRVQHPEAPRNLGLTLIAIGTLALAAASLQHRKFLRQIDAREPHQLWSVSFLVALAVVFVGLLTFYAVLLRHGPY